MKAIILNASAWMIVPVMDAFAKYLSSSMDVLQITWAFISLDEKTSPSIN